MLPDKFPQISNVSQVLIFFLTILVSFKKKCGPLAFLGQFHTLVQCDHIILSI